MTKKRLLLLSTGTLVALLLVGVLGQALVFAQETDPASDEAGFFGPRGILGWGDGSWTMFDTAAEALGLTPNELFVELHDEGKTLAEVSEEQGVEIEAVQEALDANRVEARRQSIAQAVEDGTMSQQQANWLLEGLDKGFMGGGRGLGPVDFGGRGAPGGAPAAAGSDA